MNNKVALLLPRSVIYQSINFDLLAGLRLGLENLNLAEVEIKTESSGVSADDKAIYSLCEKFLIDGIKVVAGYVNPGTAEKLEPLFASADALFISLDAGYQFGRSLKKLPHVFYVSLQGGLCCRIATKQAVNHGLKKMAYVSSFYEAGYRSAFSFFNCLHDDGCEVTFNHITKLKRAEFTLEPLTTHIGSGEPEGVFAAFCGDMLEDFFNGVRQEPAFARLPVYGASFVGEEQWLDKLPYPGIDIITAVPWARGLDSEANSDFIAKLAENKKKANVFSLLGWDASILIAEALSAADTAEAIFLLEGFEFKSPRGTVTINADTHQFCAPVFEATIVENVATGNCKLDALKESGDTKQQRELMERDIQNVDGPFTSWLNAYACLES